MFQSQEAIDLNQKYEEGQRNFQGLQLRRGDLRGLNLSYTDFRGVDLSYANLRDVDFTGADLREAYLNEADLTGVNLTGANLEGASLIKVYLIKANCYQTNFSKAYLTGAYLTKTNFKEARFNGAYLNGVKLSGAKLRDASYDEKTRFDYSFNPESAFMNLGDNSKRIYIQPQEVLEINPQQQINIPTINIEQFLEAFNHLTTVSRRYLGKTMTEKYWESSRPAFDWLEHFEMIESAEIIFKGELETVLNAEQLQWLQLWLKTFIKNCCQILQNYPAMLDLQLVKPILSSNFRPNNPSSPFDQSGDSPSKKSNSRVLLSV
ncbi:pentapeptide repeat-containing protein [Crocosphaera sp. Alani8]|uniref:pentapeptide repeat-containing protein n=1 Tax=Crocosphaera sp. Alani8 TaxID=3038952 RepID=UPI00313A7EFD